MKAISALNLVASRLLQTMENGRVLLALFMIVAYTVEESTPFSPEYICRYVVEGLNEAQINICIHNTDAMVALYEVENKFDDECERQFIDNRWNCTGSDPPITGETSRTLERSTKEAAFVYALTSAATVHTITKACSAGDIEDCGCDTSLNGQETLQGWQWGGCSDDVEYGARFASDFLDAREIEAVNKTESEIALALVHLHNNAVGRMAVQDGMEVECICHGASGSCTTKTCWRKVPSLHSVGDAIKSKYDQAVKVSVQHTKNSPATLRSVGDESATPTTDYLVFTKQSLDYCSDDSEHNTVGRECLPESVKANITAGIETPGVKINDQLPICEDFCCNGEYQKFSKSVKKSCNCRFHWCCDVKCEDCTITEDKYTCTG